MTSANLRLNAENAQCSAAYEVRYATYKLSRPSTQERARGGVQASAGNHSQGGSDSGDGTWYSMYMRWLLLLRSQR